METVLLEEFNCPLHGLGRLGVTSDAGDACYDRLRARYSAQPTYNLKSALLHLDAVFRAALNPTSQYEGRNWYLDDYNREACLVESQFSPATTPTPLTWITAIDRPSTSEETLPSPPRVSTLTSSEQNLLLRLKGKPPMTGITVQPGSSDAPYEPAPGETVFLQDDAAKQVIQNNPAALNTPAPGTTPIHPAQVSNNLWDNILNTLNVGASQYQQYQITNAMLTAQRQGKVVFVPNNVVQQAQQRTSGWVYAGAGVAALAIIGLVIYAARKS